MHPEMHLGFGWVVEVAGEEPTLAAAEGGGGCLYVLGDLPLRGTRLGGTRQSHDSQNPQRCTML